MVGVEMRCPEVRPLSQKSAPFDFEIVHLPNFIWLELLVMNHSQDYRLMRQWG